jgi:uncharacterized protein (UPF0276 family)
LKENIIDYLKLEGNLSGSDLFMKNIIEEPPYLILTKAIANGCNIRFLDFSNVKVKQIKKGFWNDEVVENLNMTAILEILRTINCS